MFLVKKKKKKKISHNHKSFCIFVLCGRKWTLTQCFSHTVQQEITQLGFKLSNMPFSLWDHRVNYPKAQCSLEARETLSKPNSRPIMIHYTVSHCKLMQLLSFILRQTSCWWQKQVVFYLSQWERKKKSITKSNLKNPEPQSYPAKSLSPEYRLS